MNNNSNQKLITLYPKTQQIKGRVLLSYLAEPLLFTDEDKRFNDHSNKWESREIAKIFNSLSFIVDAIDFNNDNFYPQKHYDIVFDIHYNLQRFIPFLNKKIIKILHITGSYPRFSVDAELKRVADLEKRRGFFISPKRIVDTEIFDRSLRFADHCSLIGNDCTLNSFPKKYHDKITKVTVSASKLSFVKSNKDYVPEKREFLWFFGGGAVHKGLDRVLEVFAKHKNLFLNVFGVVQNEKDFCKLYEYELTKLPNIRYHGFLMPKSKKFLDIVKNVFCFIAPSCSEGISPSVATCLQLGLYPIISRNTGVTLPDNCGVYLKNSSVEEIEKRVLSVYDMKKQDLEKQIYLCQKYALQQYSRENFTKDMTNFISKIIDQKFN